MACFNDMQATRTDNRTISSFIITEEMLVYKLRGIIAKWHDEDDGPINISNEMLNLLAYYEVVDEMEQHIRGIILPDNAFYRGRYQFWLSIAPNPAED